MPSQSRVFRLFVSSTFSDMAEERQLLQGSVFPKLTEMCRRRNARFQAVDLRWGVTEESQMNQQTLQICLSEIDRCQRVSPRPNFLILLGDKYGWQPLPEKIPEDEWNQISGSFRNSNLMREWYRKDENACPPEYVLQARTGESRDWDTWASVEEVLRSDLRQAVSSSEFNEFQKSKFEASATHQEIIRGALNPPPGVTNPEDHVLAYMRETSGMPRDASASGYIDLENDLPDGESRRKLNSLKEELQERLGKNCLRYEADWDGSRTRIRSADSFAEAVFEKLKTMIEWELDVSSDGESLDQEIAIHRIFQKSLTESFQGRQDSLSVISDYLTDESPRALALIGASGSGKSSVMSAAISEAESRFPDALISYRYCGISSESSDAAGILRSLIHELCRHLGRSPDDFSSSGDSVNLMERGDASRCLHRILWSDSVGDTKIVLFIDALDQLSEEDTFYLNWLPSELSGRLKVVVSALPYLDKGLAGLEQVRLPVLPTAVASDILDSWLQGASRTLQDEQKAYVMKKFRRTGLPIYLKIAFEHARDWPSYGGITPLDATVPGIIGGFVSDLEKRFPRNFVEYAICYLLSGRFGGLAEKEILDALVSDEDFWPVFLSQSHPDHRDELETARQIPNAVWSRFLYAMEPFLTEKNADGVPIITFFHRQFTEVLQARYELLEECRNDG